MSGKFTGNFEDILFSSEEMRAAVRAAADLVPFFEDQARKYRTWAGVRGAGDPLADEFGEAFDRECEMTLDALRDMAFGFLNVADLVYEEGEKVSRPQRNAVDSIHTSDNGRR